MSSHASPRVDTLASSSSRVSCGAGRSRTQLFAGGRSLSSRTAGQLVLGQTRLKQTPEASFSPRPDGSRLTKLGTSSPISKQTHKFQSSSATAANAAARLEACYGAGGKIIKTAEKHTSLRCEARTNPAASMASNGCLVDGPGCGNNTCSSSSSCGALLRFASSTGNSSEGGGGDGTHSVLAAALMGSVGLNSLRDQPALSRLAPLAESPSAMDTEALHAKQSVQMDIQGGTVKGAQTSTCEFLAEELSSLNAARAAERAAAGASDGASKAGLTCEMLEAAICSFSSRPMSPCKDDPSISRASLKQLSAATCIQSAARRWLTRADSSGPSKVNSTGSPVEQEVQRLTQVVESYAREVLPQLMVERAVLNCELAKVRDDAVKAAEASERDKEVLRVRVAEAEAESLYLMSQLASARLATLRSHGGG